MAVAHLALELGARHQRGHRIDDQHVDRTGADERVGDLERLLARIGLGDQQLVDIDAELLGIAGVERVLGVDEGASSPGALRLGDDVERQGRLARAFRSVNLDDATARQAADTEGDIEAERAGRDHLDIGNALARAQFHDRALAESAFDLAERRVQCLLLVHIVLADQTQRGLSHCLAPYSIRLDTMQSSYRTRFVLTGKGEDKLPAISCFL